MAEAQHKRESRGEKPHIFPPSLPLYLLSAHDLASTALVPRDTAVKQKDAIPASDGMAHDLLRPACPKMCPGAHLSHEAFHIMFKKCYCWRFTMYNFIVKVPRSPILTNLLS